MDSHEYTRHRDYASYRESIVCRKFDHIEHSDEDHGLGYQSALIYTARAYTMIEWHEAECQQLVKDTRQDRKCIR